jgi:CHAT domain-containing protein
VLVVLWPVEDRAARIFMEDFYSTWLGQAESDPAAALRATQLSYIASPDPARRDPQTWAPFVLFEG